MLSVRIFLASSSVSVVSFPSTAERMSGRAMYAPYPVASVDAVYVVPNRSTYAKKLSPTISTKPFQNRTKGNAHLLPSLKPPTSNEFHSGFILLLLAYIILAKYSCTSAGPRSFPSPAVNSPVTSSSSRPWRYWKSDISPDAPRTVLFPTACRRWIDLNRAREPYDAVTRS